MLTVKKIGGETYVFYAANDCLSISREPSWFWSGHVETLGWSLLIRVLMLENGSLIGVNIMLAPVAVELTTPAPMMFILLLFLTVAGVLGNLVLLQLYVCSRLLSRLAEVCWT